MKSKCDSTSRLTLPMLHMFSNLARGGGGREGRFEPNVHGECLNSSAVSEYVVFFLYSTNKKIRYFQTSKRQRQATQDKTPLKPLQTFSRQQVCTSASKDKSLNRYISALTTLHTRHGQKYRFTMPPVQNQNQQLSGSRSSSRSETNNADGWS